MSPTDDLIAAVETATGRQGKKVGRETRLLCPAHDDHRPSLDVREGDNGYPIVNCRSRGCSFEQVVRAVGREPRDFLPKTGDDVYKGEPIIAFYDYKDELGKLLFQVCRTLGKQFPQRRPDGAGGWIWNLKDV